MQVSNMTGPGIQRSSVLCWLNKPVAITQWKPPEFGSAVEVGIKSSSITRSRFSEMSDQWKVSL